MTRVTGLTAQDALIPNIIAVAEEMRSRDVTLDLQCEVLLFLGRCLPRSRAYPAIDPFS